jgi:hypothetical protein
VVDVAAADDATALAFQQLLADRWATPMAQRMTRDVGQPGEVVRAGSSGAWLRPDPAGSGRIRDAVGFVTRPIYRLSDRSGMPLHGPSWRHD